MLYAFCDLVYGIQCDNGATQQSECVKGGQRRAIHLFLPGHCTQSSSFSASSIKQMIKMTNKAKQASQKAGVNHKKTSAVSLRKNASNLQIFVSGEVKTEENSARKV